ncbi:MAG: purine-nucleoside phosphorylase [Alphaproteobacteria bacterium]|nr:purine-nucleoside phosphorylase [Alphaproteobacteria bacterium]
MLDNAAQYLKEKIGDFQPDTAIILGSGLALLTAEIQNPIIIPYAEVPDFPQTSVEGHVGCFYIGTIGKHKVICMQGRFHLYENIDPRVIHAIMCIFQKLGVTRMIITNAAGSLRQDMLPGSLMLITDHINFSGRNPLIGTQKHPKFTDLSQAYDLDMRNKIKQIAEREGVKLYEGVYLMVLGPNYETPAEIRMFRNFGADAVGMSTVQEVLSAVSLGIKVIGISAISNLGTGMTDDRPNHEEVMINVAESIESISLLVKLFLEEN